MATCCAPACSQALPVKPQGVWARGSEAWAGSRDLRNLEFVRWGSSGPSSLMTPSYKYRNSHYKDKAISHPSYHHNGNPTHLVKQWLINYLTWCVTPVNWCVTPVNWYVTPVNWCVAPVNWCMAPSKLMCGPSKLHLHNCTCSHTKVEGFCHVFVLLGQSFLDLGVTKLKM